MRHAFARLLLPLALLAGCDTEEPAPAGTATEGEANQPPTVVAVSLGEGPWYTDDRLTAVPQGAEDPDGDPVSFSYQWYVNDIPVVGAVDDSLSGASFNAFDSVFVQVTPSDGAAEGDPVNSGPIVIANTPPSFSKLMIGAGPYRSDLPLTVYPGGWQDPDGDGEEYRFAWYVNGTRITGAVMPFLEPSAFERGDTVRVEAVAHDGYDAGELRTLTVTIANAPPRLAAATLEPGPWFTGDSITVTPMGASDPDGDEVHFAYRWWVDDSEAEVTAATLPSAYFAKGQTVRAEVIPWDGAEAGASLFSNTVTIQNSAPTPPTITLEPQSLVGSAGFWVQISAAAADRDGDVVSLSFTWFRNGVPMGYPVDTTFVASTEYAEGDEWVVTVNASDGMTSAMATAVREIQLQGAAAVFAGSGHSCLITSLGRLRCWGSNTFAELGFGVGSFDQLTPADVIGIDSPVVSAALGAAHTCALDANGYVYCWGLNSSAAVGIGSNTSYVAYPTLVTGLPGPARFVASQGNHTCTVLQTGGVMCWGLNDYGQIGNGASGARVTEPADVVGLAAEAVTIATGIYHSCAILRDGRIQCWGDNTFGQLATGAAAGFETAPTAPMSLTEPAVSLLAGWMHTCALLKGGTVQCWGGNSVGQLGNGTFATSQPYPSEVEGLTGVRSISGGPRHNCAVLAAGDVWCWGYDAEVIPGAETVHHAPTPVRVELLTEPVAHAAVGITHTCALTSAQGVRCWGINAYGQLGTGQQGRNVTSPVEVGTFQASRITAGHEHTCFVGESGSVLCAGRNEAGQTFAPVPKETVWVWVIASDMDDEYLEVAAGEKHTCGILSTGAVRCWGDNSLGQLGSTFGSVDLSGDSARKVAAGRDHTCVVLEESGTVRCWGSNHSMQIGDMATVGSEAWLPTEISGLAGVTEIAAGSYHTCALAGGNVFCWGENMGWQSGVAYEDYVTEPTNVPLAGPAVAVAAGEYHSCAVLADGNAYCWGSNLYGQLGDGVTRGTTVSPVPVAGVTNLTGVEAGEHHSCAVNVSGAVFCWGQNDDGRVGDGFYGFMRNQLTARQVDIPEPVMSLSLGGRHSCAVTADDRAFCWGDNSRGQVRGSLMVMQGPSAVVGY